MEYFFADLTLAPARRELRRGSEPIAVEPQVFDLLLYLIENHDRVVSKDDLIAAVWHGRIVSESTLTSRINAARKAVGDNGERQALIRTVARKGFRFVGEFHVPAQPGATPANEEPLRAADSLSPTPRSAAAVGAFRPTRRRQWMMAGSIAAAMAIVLFTQFTAPSRTTTGQPRDIETAGGASIPADAIAVAVLPFANLSTEPEQEFFSDGITEEITSALAKIPNLNVVARTSAFEFKGQNRNIRAIAQTLHATHLIEGSVRKAGDQVRITVQLIEAKDGLRIWSNSYDRQLVNIFAAQEEIAQAIAGALRVPLGLAAGERLVSSRTIDPASYQQYLRARRVVQQITLGAGPREAIALLEPVAAREPNFAPAWAQLALTYQLMPRFPLEIEVPVEEKRAASDQWLPKAEAAARRAIQLDPSLADGYTALGNTLRFRGRFVEAHENYSKALALDPFSPDALHATNLMLGALGHFEDALAIKQRLLHMEPFVNAFTGGLADLLWTDGQTDAAIATLKSQGRGNDLAHLAAVYWTEGRAQEARDTLMAIPRGFYPDGMVDAALNLLRTGPEGATLAESLPRFGRRLDFVYFPAGVPERALERFEDNVAAGYSLGNEMLAVWTPVYAPVRGTEGFKAFVRNAGLVAHWRAKGWPKFCRPTQGDDFVCE